MNKKIKLVISLICFFWIFVYVGLTAVLDDYYSLGWWWQLMMLPTWIWIFVTWSKVFLDWRRSKLKQKG